MFESILLKNTSDTNIHYLTRYIRLIKLWNVPGASGYLEKHHILPKHMFPEYKNLNLHPWNLIKLSPRQHIIAHYILMKAYPKSWKLAHSVLRTYGQYHNNNAQHTRMVADARYQSSVRKKGWIKPPVSVSTREKLSNSKKLFYSNPENRLKQSEYCKGTIGRTGDYHKPKSEQHRLNLSASLFGRKRDAFTIEHRKNISKANLGKVKSPEHLKNLSNSLKNQTRYICPHCAITATSANITRWHGDKCKFNPNPQT